MFPKKCIIILSTLCFGLFSSIIYAKGQPAVLPEAMQQYIQTISKQYGFNRGELTKLFAQAKINEKLLDYFHHAYEKKPWYQYRKHFVNDQLIQDGVVFWRQHQKILLEAQQKYHVPANLIVALLGIETHYGTRQGDFPIFSTLTTLAFYYPERAKFFRGQLTEYLLMTREQRLPVASMKGSYAGAMGMPQFMPSAYRHYAVDYSNQNSADLINQPKDAIFSVANYLNKMGWQVNTPIAERLNSQNIPPDLVSLSARPRATLAQLKSQGVNIPKHNNMQNRAAIVKLEIANSGKYGYWLVFNNFRAIMRYNPRINYAMAAWQLSKAIENACQQTTTSGSASTPPAR